MDSAPEDRDASVDAELEHDAELNVAPDAEPDVDDASLSDLGSLEDHDMDAGVDEQEEDLDNCEEVHLTRFTDALWPQLFEPRCHTCHGSQGIASGTRFKLTTPAERETWAEDNLARISALALERLPEHEGRSILELKPTNAVSHGGATVFEEDSAPHQLLVSFIDELNAERCDVGPEPPETPYYEGVTWIDPQRLLRRVTLTLNGRIPSEEETSRVTLEGLSGVESLLESIMEREAFIARVKEGFDDILLTRGYTAVAGAVLSYAFFTTRHWVQGLYTPPESYRVTDDYDEALRREPVELIAHLVRNDLPFTEALTADYMMISPYTARGYGVFEDIQDQFTDSEDPFEFIPTRLPPRVHRNGQMQVTSDGHYPHAGLLTTPQFLHRYPSTDTNRNRARARHVYKLFLGFDILASAPAVSDSAAVTAQFDNPTLEAPECVACHRILDPLAGLFQDYNNDGEFHFRSEPWFTDMFAPGYELSVIPEEELGGALRWFGQQAAQDERFAVAMAEHVHYILTQERVSAPPLEGPEEARAAWRGYLAQREAINDAAQALRDGQFNLKAAFRSLIMSDYYRADGLVEGVAPERVADFEVLGLGAPLTPEQLIRKVEALFGVRLAVDPLDFDQRRSTYLLYGGIDYRQVTRRAATPSGAMGALMRKHANQLACQYALREFWGAQHGPYSLFPHVDEDTLDEALIRQNLVWLHQLILGQSLATDDAEIDRSYRLFSAVQQAGVARVAGGEDTRLVYDCRREAPAPNDSDYVMRSWQAVLSYLLRRPEFLLQ